jgi:hypothetical protein
LVRCSVATINCRSYALDRAPVSFQNCQTTVVSLQTSPNPNRPICRATANQIRHNSQAQYGLAVASKRTHNLHPTTATLLPYLVYMIKYKNISVRIEKRCQLWRVNCNFFFVFYFVLISLNLCWVYQYGSVTCTRVEHSSITAESQCIDTGVVFLQRGN